MAKPTSVYIIASGDHVKIGAAADPHVRLKGINTGSPVAATVYRTRLYDSRDIAMQVERRLHRYFAKDRSNLEWFKVSKEAAWRALCRLDTPAERGAKKSHHVGLDQDNLAMEELRTAMNAVEADERSRRRALM